MISITLIREHQYMTNLIVVVVWRGEKIDLFIYPYMGLVTFDTLLLCDRTNVLGVKELVGAKG